MERRGRTRPDASADAPTTRPPALPHEDALAASPRAEAAATAAVKAPPGGAHAGRPSPDGDPLAASESRAPARTRRPGSKTLGEMQRVQLSKLERG
jgi:hypothetical protein